MAYYENNDLLNFIAENHGIDAAVAIQEAFGGEAFYIPKKQSDDKQDYIRRNIAHKSLRQIARDTGLSVRQVQRRVNWPMSKGQQRLFNN